jgi:hypothetical protein
LAYWDWPIRVSADRQQVRPRRFALFHGPLPVNTKSMHVQATARDVKKR